MIYYIIKLIVTAGLIVLVSEVSKRYTLVAGVLASLPLVSYIGMIWLYIDTRNPQKVIDLSWDVFWLVIPSLTLFIALPLLMKHLHFVAALPIATLVMFAAYGLTVWLLHATGIKG